MNSHGMHLPRQQVRTGTYEFDNKLRSMDELQNTLVRGDLATLGF
jgi:hypothetical protein